MDSDRSFYTIDTTKQEQVRNQSVAEVLCSVFSLKEHVVTINLLLKTVSLLTEQLFLVHEWGGSPGNPAAVPQTLSLVLLFL